MRNAMIVLAGILVVVGFMTTIGPGLGVVIWGEDNPDAAAAWAFSHAWLFRFGVRCLAFSVLLAVVFGRYRKVPTRLETAFLLLFSPIVILGIWSLFNLWAGLNPSDAYAENPVFHLACQIGAVVFGTGALMFFYTHEGRRAAQDYFSRP